MLSTVFSFFLSYPFLLLRLTGSEGSFPRPLSASEERECLERLAEGDQEARAKLIEHNLRLVAHIVKKYYSQTCEQDDLISIGTVGLIKGITSFKPDKGIRLATYASRCIENELLMYFRSSRKFQKDVSMSDALEGDKEGAGLSIMDTLAVEDDMLDSIGDDEAHRRVRELVNTLLSEREREVISLRYGLASAPLTQRETAERLGISRSYVSRIEKRALEKLRERIEREELI